MVSLTQSRAWWEADKGAKHKVALAYVSEVERVQSDVYERFLRLAALYDPHDRLTSGSGYVDRRGRESDSRVNENVVATNVDTVGAVIGRNRPRARFLTDEGDWSTQRRARRLEWYAAGLVKLFEVHEACQEAFFDAAKFGTGIVKVVADDEDEIRVERVIPDELIVDEGECRARRKPRQMHHRKIVDRAELLARFPDFEEAIAHAHQRGDDLGRWWADYRELADEQIVVVESYRLPSKSQPGARLIWIDGADLLDEPYEKAHFPFAVMRWLPRTTGWYGIGGAERVAGHQRQLNKMNWQVDRQLDQWAIPTQFVRQVDAGLRVETINRAGSIVVFKGPEPPRTVIPPAVSGETYARLDKVKDSARQEFGVSAMAAAGVMPTGIESGAAQREFKATTTERFAIQEQAHEKLFLDVVWLLLDCCKDLGKAAPEVTRKTRFGGERLRWRDVDLQEVRVQLQAASDLPTTSAGREQTVFEFAQAGLIGTDEARRLIRLPDLDRELSLLTAALEDVERCIEEILDGEILTPEPYQNARMIAQRGQMAYLKAWADGAPEEILENLRSWIVQAAWIAGERETPPGALVQGAGEQAPPVEDAPQAAPQAALASQAMQLRPQ